MESGNMKGISPLIAAVMLIAVTVGISTLVMGWFTGLAQDTTTTVSNKTTESVKCSSAQVTVEDVYVTAGSEQNGSARIVVKNSGLNAISIAGAQLYNKTGDNFSTGFVAANLDPGGIQTVKLSNVSVFSCPGDFSQAIVTTGCGGISTTFDGTPKCT